MELIVAERAAHPAWGPRKLKDVLEKRLARPLPTHTAIGNMLKKAGLVTSRKRRRRHGPPFASTGLGGLTKLSAFLLRLGIELERIRLRTPRNPEENDGHERMHRTLKAESTRPARANLLQQQERFDDGVHEFNDERPHEALGMKRPAEPLLKSSRPMPSRLPELQHPLHDDTVRVTRSGQIDIAGIGTVMLTTSLAGHDVGVREGMTVAGW